MLPAVFQKYRAWIRRSLSFGIFVQVLIYCAILPTLPPLIKNSQILNTVVFLLFSSTTVFGLTVFAPLTFFERLYWRRSVPEVFLHGRWSYHCKFYPPEPGPLKKSDLTRIGRLVSKIDDATGEVTLHQSIDSLEARDGHGHIDDVGAEMVTTWNSRTIHIGAGGDALICFVTNMAGIKFDGVDALSVTQRDAKRRPVTMAGHFTMIPEGEQIVLRGEISYRRVT